MSSGKRKPNFRRLEEVDREIGPQPEDTATVLISQLEPRKNQPRLELSDESIDDLAKSVAQHGILNPITARFIGNATYEIIAGERRYRAALKAGLERVPVNIRNVSDEEADIYSLVENLQREDLNPYEEATGMLVLLSRRLHLSVDETKAVLNALIRGSKNKQVKAVDGELEQQQAVVEDTFKKLGSGSWKTFVTYKMRVLKLPSDVIELLNARKIPYNTALELSKIRDGGKRQALCQTTLHEKLTTEEVKERVGQVKGNQTNPSPGIQLSRRISQVSSRLKKLELLESDARHNRIKALIDELEQLLEL